MQQSSARPQRRRFLKGLGVGLALPVLDAFLPRRLKAAEESTPKRLVCICTSLGLHAPFLFPKAAGSDYEVTQYLKLIEEHRNDFTLFNGISHPDQSGADGHSSGMTWLTSAPHPGLAGFRNTISIDQIIAERIGLETRFSSLQLSTDGSSQSFTRSGIMIPGERSPAKVFATLFLDGSEQEKAIQVQRLREGRSIMDAVLDEALQFGRRVGKEDNRKLEEYYSSVREMEQRLSAAEAWIHRPKPVVDASQPEDIKESKDLIGQMELLFQLIPLAVQTDSTRLITVMIQGRNDVPPVAGVSIDHHNLSHHGQDEEKIRQLQLVEEAQFKSLEKLLADMKRKSEGDKRLLDNTTVVFGSNLGNANAHDTTNLPILLAGGRFRHGQHLVLDHERNTPLSNLFVQVAQQMGQPLETFGSSTGTSVNGLAAI
jgi:Protein of unknown function (DUF1552)